MALADTIEKMKDELNDLKDRTGIPIKLILEIVAFLLLPHKTAQANPGKLVLLVKAISDVGADSKEGEQAVYAVAVHP